MNASLNIIVKNPAQALAILEFAAGLENGETPKIGKTTKPVAKKAAAVVEESEDLLMDTEEMDELGFDGGEAEELEEKPKAKKEAPAKKLTDKDVNAAALAHAKENGRPATLAILNKKFKVKSILELKPEQYGAVITALAV